MDQSQQYMYGYGYAGSVPGRYKESVSCHDYRPYYLPERRNPCEHKPMISSFAHTHQGCHDRRHSRGGEVPNYQSGLVVSPLQNTDFTTSPGTSDKGYAYSGNTSSQGIANGYGPAGWAIQQTVHCRNQESGISGVMQARSDPTTHLRQRYPDPTSPYGSNTGWNPNVSPIEQMSVSFNDALVFPYPESPTTCADCPNHPHMDGVPVYHHDQRGIDSYTNSRFQGTKNYFLRPAADNVLSKRQLPSQGIGRVAPHDDRLDVPCLEQPKLRSHIRKLTSANAPNEPVMVHADEHGANNNLSKRRKRKPRVLKPRKPRTLTNEGKAHAKAVRDCPGGACADCRRKKTKCIHKLPEDMPMESPEKWTPNTPWTEPPTPDYGSRHFDPVFYRSPQENDLSYENIDD